MGKWSRSSINIVILLLLLTLVLGTSSVRAQKKSLFKFLDDVIDVLDEITDIIDEIGDIFEVEEKVEPPQVLEPETKDSSPSYGALEPETKDDSPSYGAWEPETKDSSLGQENQDPAREVKSPLLPETAEKAGFMADQGEVAAAYAQKSHAQTVMLESYVALDAQGAEKIASFLWNEDSFTVYYALSALEEIGPEAVVLLPDLIRLYEEKPEHRKELLRVFRQIGPKAAPAALLIVTSLDDDSLATQIFSTLLAMGGNYEAAVYDRFVAFYASSESEKYSYSKQEIEAIVIQGGENAIPALARHLQSSDEKGRERCATALFNLGDKAQEATPVLLQALQDSNKIVKRRSMRALALANPNDPGVLAVIRPFLQDPDLDLVYESIWALRSMHLRPADLLPEVLAVLTREGANSSVLTSAGWLIGEFGPQSLPTLIEHVEKNSPGLKGAIWALRSLGPEAQGAVPALQRRYKSADSAIQGNILWALGYIGGDVALGLLKQGVNSDDSDLQIEAIEGLGNLAGYKGEKEAILVDFTKSEDRSIKLAALEALMNMGEQALDVLLEALKTGSEEEQIFAMITLAQMGFKASPALEVLDQLAEKTSDEDLQEIIGLTKADILQLAYLDLPELKIPDYEDLNGFNDLDWELAVIHTMELMRSLYGELTVEEEAKFVAEWEPFFQYPSQEMVEYLKKLNPLLMRFVALRTAYVQVSFAYQDALMEVQMAGNFGFVQEYQEALARAELSLTLISSLQRQLGLVAAAIDELGPLPNPKELADQARRRFADNLDVLIVDDLDLLNQEEWEGAQYWVLVDMQSSVVEGVSSLGSAASVGGKVEYASSIQEGSASGTEVGEGGGFSYFENSGSISWTPLPRLIRADGPFEFNMKIKGSFKSNNPDWEWMMNRSSLGFFDSWNSVFYAWSTESDPNLNVNTDLNLGYYLDPYISEKTGQKTYEFGVRATVPGGQGVFVYRYELQELSTAEVEDLNRLALEELQKLREEWERLRLELAERSEAIQNKISGYAFQKEQAKYFKAEAEATRQELLRTSDPAAKEALAWRLLVAEANQQGALDQVTTIETGQFVRTPTAYDSYVQRRIGEQSRELAEEFAERQRIINAIPRQLALAPPDLKADLANFVDRNLNLEDLEKMRQVAGLVSNQIQAYWEGEGAKQDEAAINADENIFWANTTKMAAGMILTGGAGPAATSLGFSSQAVAWAPTVTKLMYAGTTGYIEGGPKAAVKETISWSHRMGSVAVAAYEGYQEGSHNGWAAGLQEAAWRGGQAYVLDRVMEYGTQLVARGASSLVASPKEQLDFKAYQQEMDKARNLVKNWQDTQRKLATVSASGVADARSAKLSVEALDLVTAINSSYQAKWLLKHQAPTHVQALFNNQLNQVYASVMPEFYQNLAKMGYDTSNLNFNPIRNAKSCGSVGMDYDLALDESTRVVIVKNGTATNRFTLMDDAQEAMNQAYLAQTGQSAIKSEIIITTRAHPEAFADAALLSRDIDFASIKDGNLVQAGDVFRTKVSASGQGATTEIGKVQAISRDLEKEMATKVLPFMEYRLQQEALRGNRETTKQLLKANSYWERVYEKVDLMGKQETNPYRIRQIQKELEAFTGHNIENLVEQLATHFETLGKFYK